MSYTHLYPWQHLTRRAGLRLTHAFDVTYDAERLRDELAVILREFAVVPHYRPYLATGWGAITLVGPNGDPHEHRPIEILRGPVRNLPTPALERAPYIRSIVDSFGATPRRVRLMRLEPGKRIFWHHDGNLFGLDRTCVRLHIPIVTNPRVEIQVSHEDCRWMEGRLYFLDNGFPHRLHNGGTEGRVHLVFDLDVDDAVRAMFPASLTADLEARAACRRACRQWLDRTVGVVFRIRKRLDRKLQRWRRDASPPPHAAPARPGASDSDLDVLGAGPTAADGPAPVVAGNAEPR